MITKYLLTLIIILNLTVSAFGQGSKWRITGNNGLTSANFLGTKDNVPLIIKTNNTERMRIRQGIGNISIGSPPPVTPFNIRMDVMGFAFTPSAGSTAEQLEILYRGRLPDAPNDYFTIQNVTKTQLARTCCPCITVITA